MRHVTPISKTPQRAFAPGFNPLAFIIAAIQFLMMVFDQLKGINAEQE